MMTAKQRAVFEVEMQRLVTGMERQHDEAMALGDHARAAELAGLLREASANLRWLRVRLEFTAAGAAVN